MNTTKKQTKPKPKKNVNSKQKQTKPKTNPNKTDRTLQRGGGGCLSRGTQVYPVFNISTDEQSEFTSVFTSDQIYDIPDTTVPEINVETHIDNLTKMADKKTWAEEDFETTRKLLKVQFNFDVHGGPSYGGIISRLKQRYYEEINVCNATNLLLSLPNALLTKIYTSLKLSDADSFKQVSKILADTAHSITSDLSMERTANWDDIKQKIYKQSVEDLKQLKQKITNIFDNFTWLCLEIPLILTRTIKGKKKIIAMPFTLSISKNDDDDYLAFSADYGNTYDAVQFKGTYEGTPKLIKDLSISNKNDQSFTKDHLKDTNWVEVCSSWIAFQACKVLNASSKSFANSLYSQKIAEHLNGNLKTVTNSPFLKDILQMYNTRITEEELSVYYLVKIFDFDAVDDQHELIKTTINEYNSVLTTRIPVETQNALFNLITTVRNSTLVDDLQNYFTELDSNAPKIPTPEMPGEAIHHLYEQEVVPLHYHISLTTKAQGGRPKKNKKPVYVKSKDEVIYKGKTYKIYSKVNSNGGSYIKIKNQDTKMFEYKRVKK
jgi:hypothetical protein